MSYWLTKYWIFKLLSFKKLIVFWICSFHLVLKRWNKSHSTFSSFNYVHKNTNLYKRRFNYHGYKLFHCCNKNLCVSTNTSTSFDPCSRYHRLLRYHCKNKSIFTRTLWNTPLTRKFRPEFFCTQYNLVFFFFFVYFSLHYFIQDTIVCRCLEIYCTHLSQGYYDFVAHWNIFVDLVNDLLFPALHRLRTKNTLLFSLFNFISHFVQFNHNFTPTIRYKRRTFVWTSTCTKMRANLTFRQSKEVWRVR